MIRELLTVIGEMNIIFLICLGSALFILFFGGIL